MRSASEGKVVALIVPLPAQGHLNQLLHLAGLLAGRSIPVHFAAPAAHNRQARARIHGWAPDAISAVHFHDLPLPSVRTPRPDPLAKVKFPAHLQPVFDAVVTHLPDPVTELILKLSGHAQRVVVIHDSLMSFAAKAAAAVPNAEAYIFHTASAFTFFFFSLDSIPKQTLPNKLKQEVIPSFPSISYTSCFTQEFLDLIQIQLENVKFDVGQIYNSCRPIEGRFLDLIHMLPNSVGPRPWALGPLNPILSKEDASRASNHPCMKWLDKQPSKSVIYVSFGTMSAISDEQVEQLAIGLKRSNHRFLWVLREADGGDVFSDGGGGYRLPDGYVEEVAGKGTVVQDWAPQLAILSHGSTGGFMSHCGWNSCVESLTAGVPIAAWPLASDQPGNATLVTEVLRAGVAVRDWSRWEAVVTAEEVESAVNQLMESPELRARASEIGVAIQKDPRADLDLFVAHITRS